MCQDIIAYATNEAGERRRDIPEIEFQMPMKFTQEKPTCTCYIGMKEGDGKTLRQTFVEEVLQPLLQQVGYGNIVIELR